MMKLLKINNTNAPNILIITTEAVVGSKQALMKHYLQPLQEFKQNVHFCIIDLPKSNKLRKAEFEQELEQILNYCHTQGITNIATTISDLMRHFTRSTKTYKFEVGQGSFEKAYDLNIFPLLNYQVLKFNPNKVSLLNSATTAILNMLRGNTTSDNIIDDIEMNLKFKDVLAVEKVLQQLLNKPLLTCDIETTGLRFESDSILTISFAWDERHAVSIGVHEQYHNKETHDKIIKLLKEFFTKFYQKGNKVIGHNFAMFDLLFITHEVMRNRDWKDTQFKYLSQANVIDTLLMAWIAKNSTERPDLGLKELAYYKMGNYDGNIDQKRLIEYSFEDVAHYNNLDCIANWVVYKDLLKEYEETPEYSTLFKKYDKIKVTIANMQMQGLVVDLEKVEQATKKLELLVQEVFKKLEDFVEYRQTVLELNEIACKKYNDSHVKQKTTTEFNEKFKPNSGKHKTVLFQDVLGIMSSKNSKKTGDPSWDKEVLNEIASSNHKVGSKIAQLLLEFNQASIVKNTFLKAFKELSYKIGDDYRLFTHFKLNGTVSGRLAAASPNLN